MTHVLTVYNTSSVSLSLVKTVCIEVCEVSFRAREMVSKFHSFLIYMLSSGGFCHCCLCFICGVRLKLRFLSLFIHDQVLQHHFFILLFSSTELFLYLYTNSIGHICVRLFMGSVLSSFDLFSFCHNHMVLLALAIYYLKFNFLFF